MRAVVGAVSLAHRGKHRRIGRHSSRIRRRAIAMVDARTLTEHRLTDDAMAAGRCSGGSYVALCGLVVLPAAMTVGETGHCRDCTLA